MKTVTTLQDFVHIHLERPPPTVPVKRTRA